MKLRTLHLLALSALTIPLAGAQIIDQQNDPQPITQKDAVAVTASGQTFKPTLGGIDFADFIFNNFDGTPGQMSLRIRDGIGGTILGTSDIVNVPGDNTFNYYRFTFPSQITLTPGHTYALEPFQLSGGTVWICERLEDNYADGAAYWGSGSLPAGWNFDYNFREGVVQIPEPAPWSLLSLAGVASALGLVRFRRNKLTVQLK